MAGSVIKGDVITGDDGTDFERRSVECCRRTRSKYCCCCSAFAINAFTCASDVSIGALWTCRFSVGRTIGCGDIDTNCCVGGGVGKLRVC